MAGPKRPIRDGLGFFGRFLRNPTSVGAVLPSSRYLSRALVGHLDLAPGELIVEFGPGTGPATAVLHGAMPAGARYLGIELDPKFHKLLSTRFPGFDFELGSAADVRQILAQRELPRPRRIVSGLPFASLPPAVQDGVVDGIVFCLRGGDGDFRTFQYVHAYGLRAARRFRAMMQERFDGFERIGPVVRNVPPAFVLRYWGAK
ncbi:MAG: phospholipid methyltransferase [Planctomycetes bacterium]|nr:phospholipid methyltransferase [Planctomycetota bacterium]MCC7399322.1 phospholipid methyltransferase [Planctomycetota bacterium]